MIVQGEFDQFLDMRGIHDSLVRSFWEIVAFDGFRSDSFFRDKLYRRAEKVVEGSPFLMGICFRRRVPGFVVLRPRFV